MNAAPHTVSPRKQLRAARAMASLERASTSRVDQEFMTKIRNVRITQKMLKMKIDPIMCMKTKENMTE
jgi:hypothetical protein